MVYGKSNTMRAAARRATRQIAAQASHQDEASGDDLDVSNSLSQSSKEDEADVDSDSSTEEEHNVFSFDIGSIDFRTGTHNRVATRRVASIQTSAPSYTSHIPLRTTGSSTNIDISMAGSRGANGVARQNVRDGIVQQWNPSRTNGASTAATNGSRAPPTPPINEADDFEIRRRDLEEKIMRQVEENGIERPKGYDGTNSCLCSPSPVKLTSRP